MIYWKSKTLLVKPEDTYGVDSAPTGAANAILALNVRLSPMEGQDTERDLEKAHFGANPTIPTGLYQRLTFDVEAVPSVRLCTGGAPDLHPLHGGGGRVAGPGQHAGHCQATVAGSYDESVGHGSD